eukprot:scaffold179986_cov20-Prasinocladus_malaysianus.AAC.1
MLTIEQYIRLVCRRRGAVVDDSGKPVGCLFGPAVPRVICSGLKVPGMAYALPLTFALDCYRTERQDLDI